MIVLPWVWMFYDPPDQGDIPEAVNIAFNRARCLCIRIKLKLKKEPRLWLLHWLPNNFYLTFRKAVKEGAICPQPAGLMKSGNQAVSCLLWDCNPEVGPLTHTGAVRRELPLQPISSGSSAAGRKTKVRLSGWLDFQPLHDLRSELLSLS